MLKASEMNRVDQATKASYFENHELNDDRLSLLKTKSGWSLPNVYAFARSGDVPNLRKALNKLIQREGNSSCINRKCVATGRSILHEAAAYGNKDIIELMVVEFKADIQSRTVMGHDSPLHLAAMHNRRNICFWLITKYGADPEAKNKYQWTPVHYAAQYGSLSTIKTIVMYGGKPSTKNHDGKTPCMIAMEREADDAITTFFFKKLEEENRAEFLIDLEGRRRENAALAAEEKAAKALETKLKKEKFAADMKKEYNAWKHPPAIRDVKT
jgi:hypothetical protein